MSAKYGCPSTPPAKGKHRQGNPWTAPGLDLLGGRNGVLQRNKGDGNGERLYLEDDLLFTKQRPMPDFTDFFRFDGTHYATEKTDTKSS